MENMVDFSLRYAHDIAYLMDCCKKLESIIENINKNIPVDSFDVENEIKQLAIKQKEVICKIMDNYVYKMVELWSSQIETLE